MEAELVCIGASLCKSALIPRIDRGCDLTLYQLTLLLRPYLWDRNGIQKRLCIRVEPMMENLLRITEFNHHSQKYDGLPTYRG